MKTKTIYTTNYELKVMNPTKNKKAMSMVNSYFTWDKESTIWTIYGKPSFTKQQAFCELRSQMHMDKGFDLRVGNQNTDRFCLAYGIKRDNRFYLIYHTAANVYCIDMTCIYE